PKKMSQTLRDRFTLVIPTYNRYPFLLRLLSFYESYGFPFSILVLDSSSDPLELEELNDLFAHGSVTYKKFDTDIFLEDKIARGVMDISTPYATLCGDDDFIIPTGVKECIKFLEQNPDYSCVQGLYIHHRSASKRKARKFKWAPLYFNAHSIEFEKAHQRVYAYLAIPRKAGGQHYYAVHRSDTLRIIRKETAKYAPVYNLGELFSGSLSLIYGKRKILPVFFSSREPHNSPFFDEVYYRGLYSPENCEKAIRGIAKHLEKAEGLRFEDAKLMAKKSLNAYVNRAFRSKKSYSSTSSTQKITLKTLRLKNSLISRLYRIPYSRLLTRKSSPFYPDYLRLKKVLLSSGLDSKESDHGRITRRLA
ncbi:MAG: TIGR00180 family glycosyltransferase, partial [Candidatus Thorarchaeota archaeon]